MDDSFYQAPRSVLATAMPLRQNHLQHIHVSRLSVRQREHSAQEMTKVLGVFVLLQSLSWLKATIKFVKGVVGNKQVLLRD